MSIPNYYNLLGLPFLDPLLKPFFYRVTFGLCNLRINVDPLPLSEAFQLHFSTPTVSRNLEVGEGTDGEFLSDESGDDPVF